MEAIARQLPLPLFHFSLDGLLIECNAAGAKTLGPLKEQKRLSLGDIVLKWSKDARADETVRPFPLHETHDDIYTLIQGQPTRWFEACTFQVDPRTSGGTAHFLLLRRCRPELSVSHNSADVPPVSSVQYSPQDVLTPSSVKHTSSNNAATTKEGMPTLAQLLEPITKEDPIQLVREEYAEILDNMAQIVLKSDPTGKIVFMNRSWQLYTGLTREQSLDGTTWIELFHPDDLQTALESYVESMRTGSPVELRYRLRRADGVFRSMLARGRPIRDAEGTITSWVSSVTDVEELVLARSQALERGEEVHAILRGANLTLLSVTNSLEAMRIGGCSSDSPDERVTGPLDVIWSDPELRKRIQEIFGRSQKQDSSDALTNAETLESTYNDRFYRYNLSHRRGHTAVNHERIMVVAYDATELVAAELALKERDKLLASESLAREQSIQKSNFVSNMSHEIRTPIAAMIGISELLLSDPKLSPESHLLVKQSLQAGSYLLDLVNAVLDMAKLESDKLNLETAPLSLTQDIATHTANMASFVRAKGLIYEQSVDIQYQGSVIGDKLRLNQILSNALSNANKFTAEGRIELTIRQLGESEDTVTIQFAISDTGIGMDEKTLSTLFKPFAQADASTARMYGGSGLGLFISKELTERMHGTVELRSTLGKGSTFIATIPFPKSLKDVETPTSEIDDYISPQDIRLLLAEDNPVIQNITAKLLRQMEFTVDCVSDGAGAVDAIEKEPYDLILMDGQMPVMSGYEATKLIRASNSDRVRNVKIVALTASAFKEDEKHCLQVGMNGVIPKPVRSNALKAAICRTLATGNANGTSAALTSSVKSFTHQNVKQHAIKLDNGLHLQRRGLGGYRLHQHEKDRDGQSVQQHSIKRRLRW